MSSWPEEVFLKTVKENLHVTLFFLGFIPESMVPEICESVRRLCEAEDSFEITFREFVLYRVLMIPRWCGWPVNQVMLCVIW